MSKTPAQMLEFWEREMEAIDREEAVSGITAWSRNFIQAKIQIWQDVIDALEVAEIQREIAAYVAKGGDDGENTQMF